MIDLGRLVTIAPAFNAETSVTTALESDHARARRCVQAVQSRRGMRSILPGGWRMAARGEWTTEWFCPSGGSGLCFSRGQAELFEKHVRERAMMSTSPVCTRCFKPETGDTRDGSQLCWCSEEKLVR